MTFKNTIRIILAILTLTSMSAAFADTDTKHGITIDDLAAIRDIQTMTLSPNGKYIAFQTKQANKNTNSYNLVWYVSASKPNAKVIRVDDDGEATLFYSVLGTPTGDLIGRTEIFWSPDNQWIFFTKTKNGEVQLWRSHRSKYGSEQLTHNAGDVENLRFSTDGSKIFFTIGRTRAEVKELIEKEARQGYLRKIPLIYSPMYGAIIAPCTDGRKRYESEVDLKERECLLTLWVYDIKSGKERKATDTEVDEYYTQESTWFENYRQGKQLDKKKQKQKLSPNGMHLAWIENDNPDVYIGYFPPMVLSVSVDGKNMRCPAKACRSQRDINFRNLWWRPNGREIIFQVTNGSQTVSSFFGWTPGDASVRTILSNDDMFYDCDLKAKKLVCGQETWISPKKIVSIDLDSGEINTIADVNSEFQDLSFTKIEKIFAEDGNGYLTHAHLVYPRGYVKGQQYPLVITQYRSRGFLRGGVGDEQPIHVYAQNGIAVLSFDHGWGRNGQKESDAVKLGTERYHDLYIKRVTATAIENMVDGLVDRGIIDPERVGISGLSLGSMALGTAVLNRNYAAASTVTLAPSVASNFPSATFPGNRFNAIFGGPAFSPKGHEMRHKYAFDANAHKVDTPLLFQLPDREVFSTIHKYYALQDAGKPVEMYIYPDERHVKWQPIHKYMVYSRNLDWFNFWLQGVEDPDPAKAEQYARWRELREMHVANLEKLEENKLK